MSLPPIASNSFCSLEAYNPLSQLEESLEIWKNEGNADEFRQKAVLQILKCVQNRGESLDLRNLKLSSLPDLPMSLSSHLKKLYLSGNPIFQLEASSVKKYLSLSESCEVIL